MFVILLAFLLIAVILQGVLTPLPLVLLALLYVTIIIRHDASVLFLAFFSGLLLDTFALRSLGGTSIFLLVFTLLVLLYQRKYEINSYQFVFAASFLGSLLYLMVFGYQHIWIVSGVTSFLGVLFFGLFRLLAPLFRHNTGLHYNQ